MPRPVVEHPRRADGVDLLIGRALLDLGPGETEPEAGEQDRAEHEEREQGGG